ncbi:gas vesicle protein GvpM [Natronoarchaeum rubrum]|uniref:gas vesicle protein GvpM n=1 Tax=Natronoarchaeum rubrum TaxID=755311 RepID=UPI002872CD70|nr:gas vesicle protein GvpJ [Natronoarchaeum rubrum]
MEPSRDEDAVVDLLDVLLRDGAMLQADVLVTVADVPLIGINLRAAIAGMATMRDYGFFEEWDAATRAETVGEQRAATRRGKFVPRGESGTHGEAGSSPPSKRPGASRMSDPGRSPPSERPDRSKRPRESDSWRDDETAASGRPRDSERPGEPDRSSVSERPRRSERPRELDVDAGGKPDEESETDRETAEREDAEAESSDIEAERDDAEVESGDAEIEREDAEAETDDDEPPADS